MVTGSLGCGDWLCRRCHRGPVPLLTSGTCPRRARRKSQSTSNFLPTMEFFLPLLLMCPTDCKYWRVGGQFMWSHTLWSRLASCTSKGHASSRTAQHSQSCNSWTLFKPNMRVSWGSPASGRHIGPMNWICTEGPASVWGRTHDYDGSTRAKRHVPDYMEVYRILSASVMDFGTPRPLGRLSWSFPLIILHARILAWVFVYFTSNI
jgi:hypothetical protein